MTNKDYFTPIYLKLHLQKVLCVSILMIYFLCLVYQETITLILATDMARHSEILKTFKQKVDNFDYTNKEHVACVRTHLQINLGAVTPTVRIS